MIESITINYAPEKPSNARTLEERLRALEAQSVRTANDTLRVENASLAKRNAVLKDQNLNLLRACEDLRTENRTLRRSNEKMADKLTLLRNAEDMHPTHFEKWLSDRVIVTIK